MAVVGMGLLNSALMDSSSKQHFSDTLACQQYFIVCMHIHDDVYNYTCMR